MSNFDFAVCYSNIEKYLFGKFLTEIFEFKSFEKAVNNNSQYFCETNEITDDLIKMFMDEKFEFWVVNIWNKFENKTIHNASHAPMDYLDNSFVDCFKKYCMFNNGIKYVCIKYEILSWFFENFVRIFELDENLFTHTDVINFHKSNSIRFTRNSMLDVAFSYMLYYSKNASRKWGADLSIYSDVNSFVSRGKFRPVFMRKLCMHDVLKLNDIDPKKIDTYLERAKIIYSTDI